MSISPRPVNMVIISSGASYGFRRTFPFVSGATIGFTLLLIVIGFGFYASIEKYPLFFKYLDVAGSAFIIYIGYKIASSRSELSLTKSEVPSFTRVFTSMAQLKSLDCLYPRYYFLNHQIILTISHNNIFYLAISLAAWAVLGKNISTLLNSLDASVHLISAWVGY
jgi:arginine exporter protein ArgO